MAGAAAAYADATRAAFDEATPGPAEAQASDLQGQVTKALHGVTAHEKAPPVQYAVLRTKGTGRSTPQRRQTLNAPYPPWRQPRAPVQLPQLAPEDGSL